MKRMTALAIGAATALGLSAVAVVAHPNGPGAGWGPGAMMGGGFGPGMMGAGYDVDARLDSLKAALGITGDQQRSWDAYAGLVKAQAASMLARHEAMWTSSVTSPAERLALHTGFMQQRTRDLEALNVAYAELYAKLTPDQRAIADQRPRGYGYGKRGGGRPAS